MAFMECNFHSDALGMACSMNVIMPQQSSTRIGMEGKTREGGGTPVLYLLHGLSDDHSIWMRRTSIERYVAPLGLAVVMPCVHRSFYCNMEHGYNYWDFVSEELPGVVKSLFNVSDRREDTFVAGLSMGGYGAFKLALRKPENYAAACSLSGALDMAGSRARREKEEFPGDMHLVFGTEDKIKTPEHDLLLATSRLARASGKKPFFYQWCGTEDFLYADNISFRDNARREGLDLIYEEGSGDHQWRYWDEKIQRFLQILVDKSMLQ